MIALGHDEPSALPARLRRGWARARHSLIAGLPGVALCAAVAALSFALQRAEEHFAGQAYLEALVIAILVGSAIRTAWNPPTSWHPGIEVSARLFLEIAVVLLGASISLRAVAAAGPWLLVAIAAVVTMSLVASFAIGRALGLPPRVSVLIACGNSICGNSAIAAVAPVIRAHPDDVASSVAFTAVLGIVVVLGLPVLVPLLGLSPYGYGVLAGLTVYAVPQVFAATAPVGALASQVGTLVKLVRVLMLGPVVLALSLAVSRIERRNSAALCKASGATPVVPRISIHKLIPWFILGFIGLSALRSLGLVPETIRAPIAMVTSIFTVISMAALGLGVDIRIISRVGPRSIAAVTLSLLVLLALAVVTVRLLSPTPS